MSESVTAYLASEEDTLRALDELESKGFSPESIEVLMPEPLHHVIARQTSSGPPTRIGLFAVAGGVIGAVAGILITVVPSKQMGLTPGGIPVVAPWAFGVIVYEMTALGAVLTALARAVYEGGLGKFRLHPGVDAGMTDEKIVVRVSAADAGMRGLAEKTLARLGAEVIDDVQ